jgi:hypothetical protein
MKHRQLLATVLIDALAPEAVGPELLDATINHACTKVLNALYSEELDLTVKMPKGLTVKINVGLVTFGRPVLVHGNATGMSPHRPIVHAHFEPDESTDLDIYRSMHEALSAMPALYQANWERDNLLLQACRDVVAVHSGDEFLVKSLDQRLRQSHPFAQEKDLDEPATNLPAVGCPDG